MKNHRIKKLEVGQIFGKLTVISNEPVYANTKAKRMSYLVKCECGNEFNAVATKLRTGTTVKCKSCGFKDRETNRKQVTQIEQLYRRYILYRASDNISVELSISEYEQLAKSNCFYCGEVPRKIDTFESRKYVNFDDIYINGVDRIDSTKSYSLSNCVTCCPSCNYAKHTLTQDEFYTKIIKIYNKLNLEKYK